MKNLQPVGQIQNYGSGLERSSASLNSFAAPSAIANLRMQSGDGFVRVVKIRNGLAICTKKVYETRYDKDLEQDVQDNFITGLKIENGNLVIRREKLDPIIKPVANFCD